MLTACPRCGEYFALSDEAIGRKARCKRCGRAFAVFPVDPPASDRPGSLRRSWNRGFRRVLVCGAVLTAALAALAGAWLWLKGYAVGGFRF